jgi:hypothetical protein
VLAVDILEAELSFLIDYMKTVFGDLLTTLGAKKNRLRCARHTLKPKYMLIGEPR